MHPAFIAWWKHAHRGGGCGQGQHADPGGCGDGHGGGEAHRGGWGEGHGGFGPRAWFSGGCGPGGGGGERGFGGDHEGGGFGGGGPFGVKRPLRFLAFKLELEDAQVAELATILDDLKTERAQAAVDFRRTTSAFADTVASEAFDTAKADEIRAERVKSAERLQSAVARALGKIHALLDAEQRKRLAYLIRTGALAL